LVSKLQSGKPHTKLSTTGIQREFFNVTSASTKDTKIRISYSMDCLVFRRQLFNSSYCKLPEYTEFGYKHGLSQIFSVSMNQENPVPQKML
jgi:hypothetical protein